MTGSLVMEVTNVESFVSNAAARGAIREALGNLTRVPLEYIDIDLVAETKRLRARSLALVGNLLVTYAIEVAGDAPETIQVTGAEVGGSLQASNLDDVQGAVSTSIEKSLGSGYSDISIASMVVPDVIERSIPTLAPPTPTSSPSEPTTPRPTPPMPSPPPSILETPSPSPPSLLPTTLPQEDDQDSDEGEGTMSTPIPTPSTPTPAPPTPVSSVVLTSSPSATTEFDVQADEVESGANKLLGLSASHLIALLIVAVSH